jgi:hypothetical protein
MSIRERLVGTWQLVSFEYIYEDGEHFAAYGERPAGLLVYDDTGHMAAQIMNPGRRRFASGDRRAATHEELAEALAGYIAYFGTYEVFEQEGYVMHVEYGDVFPNAVGTRQKRFFAFDDDGRLVLDVPPVMLEGRRATARVVWERLF